MTQPIQIITSALRSIGALASGEAADANMSSDAFYLLNEMLDQWSNDELMVFTQQEVILELVGGKYIYNIGPSGDVAFSIQGAISGNVLTCNSLNTGAVSVGQIVSGVGVTAGTAITSQLTGLGGNGVGVVGTYTVNLSQSVALTTLTGYAPRPLRLNSAIVRVVNAISGTLDYPVAVLSYEEYQLIGIKTLPGPWPRGVYYQPTEPNGVLFFWPNPSQGEMHLYCDTVLNNFSTINDTVTLPQGYQGAIHWSLAELLMPEYGKLDQTQAQMIIKNAARARNLVKQINSQPMMPARLDDMFHARGGKDAGWILNSGYY